MPNVHRYENGNGKQYNYIGSLERVHGKLRGLGYLTTGSFLKEEHSNVIIEQVDYKAKTGLTDLSEIKQRIKEAAIQPDTAEGTTYKRVERVTDLVMSSIGAIVGSGLLFTGIFTDRIYAVAGVTILSLALFHFSWSRKL